MSKQTYLYQNIGFESIGKIGGEEAKTRLSNVKDSFEQQLMKHLEVLKNQG